LWAAVLSDLPPAAARSASLCIRRWARRLATRAAAGGCSQAVAGRPFRRTHQITPTKRIAAAAADAPKIVSVQAMGPSVLPNAKGPWQGDELVAVRLHVPAKIQFHNAPSKQVERGNIVSWEQPLKDRLAGQPLRVEVRMERNSILAWTLTIFGASAVAAVILFVLVIWWVRRKGRESAA